MTGWRLISSIPAMMRSLSSCLDATRMWRRTERANLEKKPSMRLSQGPCLGVKLDRPDQPGGAHELEDLVLRCFERVRVLGADLDEQGGGFGIEGFPVAGRFRKGLT